MRKQSNALTYGFLVCVTISAGSALGQTREEQTVRNAQSVLNAIMAVPLNGIPASMLADAKAVAIFPGVIKGSFIIGARHGNGVLISRGENGTWHAPLFMTLTGGNVGWQVGVQSTDVVLVFKTDKSVQNLLSGKFTLGADAAVAAGPVGRQASAATDLQLKAEIYSYSRSRGLFVGVAIDGSVLAVDNRSNADYYRSPGPGRPVTVPPSGIALAQDVARYCNPVTKLAPAGSNTQQPVTSSGGQAVRLTPNPALGQVHAVSEAEEARVHLAQISRDLYELLDAHWQVYLALPAEVFSGSGRPSKQALDRSLSHFKTVASDPKYQALAARAEFQSTYGLLQHYVNVCEQKNDKLVLPTPPKE
ncbi:MAG: lipid-binding SYLF domain-containing protein [Pirellulales bacterium]|nr:lipid-binding SYLF domain-containing protein [Pirellulales bacterium]